MQLPSDPPPPGRTTLDRIAYACWAFALAGLACFSVLDACTPCAPADPGAIAAVTDASP